jgi:hypothetical protein
MASFNRVILMGTRDIEVKYPQSGMAVADIGLAERSPQEPAASGSRKRRSSMSRCGAARPKSIPD